MAEYIEREAAIADLELYETQVFKSEYALAIAGCRSHIRAIPAADVEPVRHGRWINHRWYIVCSECGDEEYDCDWYDCDGRDYCPNCGAKMDGSAE